MSKIGNQRLKQMIQRERDQRNNSAGDQLITVGVWLTEIVLHSEFGFGKERLARLENAVHAFCQDEIRQGAAAWTTERRENVMAGLYRMAESLDQIMDDGKKRTALVDELFPFDAK